MGISFLELDYLYTKQRLSVSGMAIYLKCSEGKVNYWLSKYGIKKRSVSEAIYNQKNPNGDPFVQKKIDSIEDAFLFGMGLGLYWGEGTKSNKLSLRLGNTNPKLIKKYMEFLFVIYGIDKEKLKFGLQIFSDMNPDLAKDFWQKDLDVKSEQFQKVIVTPARGLGNYHRKVKHGVLTVYYHNKKLRDIICGELESL
jgi:hypothetical protein